MASKSIFIAFTGPGIDQAEPVCKIADGYECWNLKTFDLDGFIASVQSRIPPVNENVLGNYKLAPGAPQDPFAITDGQYGAAAWGLLLPHDIPEVIVDGYGETLFLLNLYSPRFLYPCFYVTDLGIWRRDYGKRREIYFHAQQQSARFRREEFVKYHQMLKSEAGYGSWNAYRMKCWSTEDWRLLLASILYVGLQDCENSKEFITWPREAADMATILETLFTAGTDDNSEVGYKLRKRAAALVAFRQPGRRTGNQDPVQRTQFLRAWFVFSVARQEV